MELKLLAWTTKWNVMSLTKLRNTRVKEGITFEGNKFDFGIQDLRYLGNPIGFRIYTQVLSRKVQKGDTDLVVISILVVKVSLMTL